MRRMLRVAAMAATCVYGAKIVWMESEENARPSPQSEEQRPDIASSIPLQPFPEQQAKAEAKEQEEAKVETDHIATPSSQSILDVIPTHPPLVLQQNEAILPSQCPADILDFLTHCGYNIHLSPDPSSPLQLKNSRGDVFTLGSAQANQDVLQLLSNFVHPPLQIISVEQAKEMLALQQKGGFYVYAYLPKQQQYDRLIQSRTSSPFDTFHPQRKANLSELQSSFSSLAYQSASNANTFLVIRSKEAAEYLKINPFSLGVPHLLTRTCRQNGNQSNLQREGQRLQCLSLAKEWRSKDPHIIDRLTHHYINKLQTQAEAANKIRQLQMAQDKRKVLLIYTSEARQQFHEQLDSVLEHVARMERQNVVVFKTQNEHIARKLFHVEPDAFTTVRLLDLNSPQPSLFQNSKTQLPFRRAKFKGAFKPQNLCRFIQESQWQEHYESKQGLTTLKPVAANELPRLDNTLVLLQKKGCQGCEYMQEGLEELKKVVKTIASASKFRKNAQWKYRIEDPNSLLSLKIRRFSIFNESTVFSPPTTTPRLYLFSQGKYLDLNLSDILGRLREVKSQSQAQAFHETVLREIIERVRKSKDGQFCSL